MFSILPKQDARDYAIEHGIELVEKSDIAKIVQQELPIASDINIYTRLA